MKAVLLTLAIAALMLLAAPALAGPYLNTSSMLLRESSAAGAWVRENLGDRDLARAAQLMAQARSDVAAHITVPTEVSKAHPHLLLALGNMERAMGAASQGQISAFVQFVNAADGETRTFKTILGELGYRLPEQRNGRSTMIEPACPSAQPALGFAWNRPSRTTFHPARLARRSDLARWRHVEQVHPAYVDRLHILSS